MALNYATALKTTRLNSVVTAVDAGSGAGTIEICTTAYGTVLATITLSDPCGTVTTDVLTFSGFPKNATAAATGTAALARIKDSNGTVVAQGLTIGTSGTDVILTSTSITSGITVTLNSATITHAA